MFGSLVVVPGQPDSMVLEESNPVHGRPDLASSLPTLTQYVGHSLQNPFEGLCTPHVLKFHRWSWFG